MITVLRQRNFALVWLGGLISLVGDQVLTTGAVFYVYRLTGSVLQTGALTIIYFLPIVLFSSMAGVFVDRWNLKRTLVAINVAQALLLLPLLLVRSAADMWIVYGVILSQSMLSLFVGPALGSLLPQLVQKEHLRAANAMSSMSNNASRLVGPPIGGSLLALVGLSAVTLVDAASFLLAATLIAFLSFTAQRASAGKDMIRSAGTRWKDTWRQWIDGLIIIRRRRLLLSLIIVGGVGSIADAMLGPIMVPFVRDELHGNAATYGWISTATGLGGMLGASLIGRVGKQRNPLDLVVLGLVEVGAVGLIRYNIVSLPIALLTFFAGGVGAAMWWISRQTALQTGTPDGYRGRVFGALGTNTALMLLAGTATASVLATPIGLHTLLNISAALYVVAGLGALLFFPRGRPESEHAISAGESETSATA